MKRFLSNLLILATALVVTCPATMAADDNPSGSTAPGQGSTSGQSLQSNLPATIPEERFKGNARFPNQLIVGGNQTVSDRANGASGQFSNIPSIVLRPFGKTPRSALDTTIIWTTPSAAHVYTIPDAGANANFLMSAGSPTFTSALTVSGTLGIIFANATANSTIVSADHAVARTYTIPDAGANASFVLTALAQSIGGVKTFTAIPVFPLGGITFTGTSFNTTLKALNAMGQATVITIPDPGAATANVVLDAGNQTIAGTKTFSTAPTITGGLTAANIQTGSAKREIFRHTFAQNIATQTAADGVTYTSMIYPGRAGTVKQIMFGAITAPTVGTDQLSVKKLTGGNTMLSAATFDANTLADGVGTVATLTGTGADLALTATQGIEVAYVAGTQTVDAVSLSVTIEYEPTDF